MLVRTEQDMRQTDYDALAALIVERRDTFPNSLAHVAQHALANPPETLPSSTQLRNPRLQTP